MRVFDHGMNTRLLVFYHVLLMSLRIVCPSQLEMKILTLSHEIVFKKVLKSTNPIRWPRRDILQIQKSFSTFYKFAANMSY